MEGAAAHAFAVDEPRRFLQRQVHPANGDLAEGIAPHHFQEVVFQQGVVEHPQEGLARLQCGHHRPARAQRLAGFQARAAGPSLLHDDLLHRGRGHDPAAIALQEGRHRPGQLLASALGNRLPVVVNCRDHDVEGLPRSLLVGKNLRRQRPVQHHRLNEVVLEVGLHPGAGRHGELLQAPQAVHALLQGARQGARRRRGREEGLDETLADLFEVRTDRGIAARVGGRIRSNGLAGALHALVNHDSGAAVAVRVAGDVVVRLDVLQPESFQFRLDRLEVGIAVDPDVRGAVQVVPESRQRNLARDGAAAHVAVALQHAATQAFAGQGRGAGQAVHAAADHDHVKIRHQTGKCRRRA